MCPPRKCGILRSSGRLGRSRPLAVHELEFAKSLTSKPVKVALPGPYTLTRTMWMECISDRAYASREDLAEDIVRVLREEAHYLLAAGAALVQFDEPVLTEAVYCRTEKRTQFHVRRIERKKRSGARTGICSEPDAGRCERTAARTTGVPHMPRELDTERSRPL